jgi:predicted nucleic acid-binding Zn ribbon protein
MPKRSDKNRDPEHIGSILGSLMATVRRQPDGDLARIFQLWEGAVGATLARNAQPAAFKGELLIVHVTSSAWAHQLRFLESDLVAKINAALDAPLVEKIRFKVGPL